MSDKSDHILLTEQEAAEILQPHMPNKSALHWLENDRMREPAVPFHLLQGEPYYVEQDLLGFIIRTLNPAARFIRVNNRLRSDNRSGSERRKHPDRRMHVEIALSLGIERRHLGKHDRRLGGEHDRRVQQAVIQRVA